MERHKEFGVWARAIDLSEDTERLDKRWAGVVSLMNLANQALVRHWILRHYSLELDREDPALATFVDAWQQANPFFDVRNGEEELRFAASATLACILDNGPSSKIALFTAQAVLSASFHGTRQGFPPVNLVDRSVLLLRQRSEADRVRPELSDAADTPWVKLKAPASDDETTDIDSAALERRLNEFVTAINSGLNRAEKSLRKDLSSVQQHLKIKDEELDILWWAYNRRSEARNVPFDELAEVEKALVVACELAQLIRMPSPPTSAIGLLIGTGLSSTDTHSIAEYIDGCDADWLVSANLPDGDTLTPTLCALTERNRVKKTKAWRASWESITDLKASTKISESEFARQLFTELLFSKAKA